MINVTILKSAADAKNYYKPDYYVEGSKPTPSSAASSWTREGLKEFDLQAFHDLCDGFVPGSRRTDPSHRQDRSR